MPIYNITLFNDMGHLNTIPDSSDIPKKIFDFIYLKADMYLANATDTINWGCRFYILKPGLNKNWTYYYGHDIINITYDLDTFDPTRMKMLTK